MSRLKNHVPCWLFVLVVLIGLGVGGGVWWLTRLSNTSLDAELSRLAERTDTLQEVTYDGTVLSLLRSDERFGRFADLVSAAKQANALEQPELSVIFAPTDEAFAAAPEAIRALADGSNEALAKLVVDYHRTKDATTWGQVIAAPVLATQADRPLYVTTLKRNRVAVELRSSKGDMSRTGRERIQTSNALVIPIHTVMIPQ